MADWLTRIEALRAPPDTLRSHMSKPFAAPPKVRRIAARRVFKVPSGKSVVLTLGVPQAVPGSDWGCPLQITDLNTTWRRPKYVFGIDSFQALHLAMQCAGVVLESERQKLFYLNGTNNLISVRVNVQRGETRSSSSTPGISSAHGPIAPTTSRRMANAS